MHHFFEATVQTKQGNSGALNLSVGKDFADHLCKALVNKPCGDKHMHGGDIYIISAKPLISKVENNKEEHGPILTCPCEL